ncbi:MAG: hypothetical protein KatS3mg105_0026 [Gemmatales bacterium]|nr:MAG: hypothetical protein KatS3mg105_0026 [Gemmatales bacterium]
MFWRTSIVLLAGLVLTASVAPLRGDDATCTISCVEWVPEKYKCKRTVYKTVYKKEKYTAYRCEFVPETRTCTHTTYKLVKEMRTVTRNVCCYVPVCEERTIMQPCVTCKPVTVMVKKWVDKGHYECRLVECRKTLIERLVKWCRDRKSCCPEPDCPKYKVKKVWVPCKVCVCVPKTCWKRVCEYRPVKVKVTTCKKVMKQEQVQVCCYKCVPVEETHTYKVMCLKKVPYEAERTVAVCVPHEEEVEMTRLVPRCVQKKVPCCTPCCKPCCH